MKISARLTSPLFMLAALEWFMDAIAFAALFVTQEVKPVTWLVGFALIGMRLTLRYRISTALFAAAFVSLVGLTLYFAFGQGMHPLVAVVQTVPVLHAMVIFSRDKERYLGWRVGVGFVSIIVASAMTPDFFLPLLVFLFVLGGIALVSCQFILRESIRAGEAVGTFTLPAGFPTLVAKQGFVIFLAGALIFPILPRVSRGGGGGVSTQTRTTGYSEEITLSEWARMTSEGNTAAALRIYLDEEREPTDVLPMGLLRSRVLNRFDGQSWKPAPYASTAFRTSLPEKGPTLALRFQREALETSSLPVPYGHSKVMTEQYQVQWLASRSALHEIGDARFTRRRANYVVHLPTDLTTLRRHIPVPDAPAEVDLSVPASMEETRIRRLADNLFRGLRDPRAKVDAILRMIKTQKYTATEELSETGKAIYDSKLSPLENFMFRTHEGHCELFSSMTAVLLRLSGVPARVIAGFRVGRMPVGNVLTVRMSDAHAWVEVYYPGTGWVPVDPTPRVLVDLSFTDWLRDGYDWMSAKWSQYVINYGEESTLFGEGIRAFRRSVEHWGSAESPTRKAFSLKESWQLPLAVVVGLGLLVVLFVTRQRRRGIRKIAWEGPRALRRERLRYERAIRGNERGTSPARTRWKIRYEALRFDRGGELRGEDLRELARLAREVGAEDSHAR